MLNNSGDKVKKQSNIDLMIARAMQNIIRCQILMSFFGALIDALWQYY